MKTLTWLASALAVCLSCGRAFADDVEVRHDAVQAPLVVTLADDDDTRGNWLGTYGSYAYLLCGMRSPHSLFGGKGWPIECSVVTGDPKETARAWQSLTPGMDDQSVLLDPSGLKRTPASFDDHGEVRPLGQGPDLHISIAVPRGTFLLSLYFFEVDWIQYRAYRIRVFAQDELNHPLAETMADNFFKGKYKRFAVVGPAKLRVVIERGQSPNAEVSGIFLDNLLFPDMRLYQLAAEPGSLPWAPTAAGAANEIPSSQAAGVALEWLLRSAGTSQTQRSYIEREAMLFEAMKNLERTSPDKYYPAFEAAWEAAEQRMTRALAALPDSPARLEVTLLRYYASLARSNYKGAREAIRQVADELLRQSRRGVQSLRKAPQLLRDCSIALVGDGRRAEALEMLCAYATYCLESEKPSESKEHLILIGQSALRAGVGLPVADALSQLQRSQANLSPEDLLLVGNLYYVAGHNEEALACYNSIEPTMDQGKRHRWLLIATETALLRLDRLDEAKAVVGRIEEIYPASQDIDEAKFRVGVYHFDKREIQKARDCFKNLGAATHSDGYKKMCSEYLERITLLESIR